MLGLTKFILFFVFVGLLLSFLNNFILLEQLENNECSPFYHGSIRPNYLEVALFGIAPIFIFLLPKKMSVDSNKGLIFLGVMIFSSVLSWTIGTYLATMEWCLMVQLNRTIYLGMVGGFEWDFRQDYFLLGYAAGLLICIKIKMTKKQSLKK